MDDKAKVRSDSCCAPGCCSPTEAGPRPATPDVRDVVRAKYGQADIVLRRPLPEAALESVEPWTGCIAGALLDTEYEAKLRAGGFARRCRVLRVERRRA